MSIVFNKEQPQKKIDGSYYDKYGEEIIIKRDRFILDLHQTAPFYGTDKIANCRISRINDELIEINSETPRERQLKAQSSLTIKQSYDPDLKDSIRVEIRIKEHSLIYSEILANFDSSLSYLTSSNYDKQYSKKYHINEGFVSVTLPGDIKRLFSVYFEPERIPYEGLDPIYRGYAYQSISLDTIVEEGKNVIKISVPAIDGGYFQQYYVKGEYVRIKENSLIWRGIEYKKK